MQQLINPWWLQPDRTCVLMCYLFDLALGMLSFPMNAMSFQYDLDSVALGHL